MKRIALLPLLTLTFISSGCVTFDTQAFDAESHADINEIFIISPAIPDAAGVTVLAPVGANFGLIGALVTESGLATKRKKLAAVIEAQQYDYRRDIKDTIAASLREAGYEVSELDVDRGKKKFDFLADYSDIGADAALLDIYVSFIGYAAAGSATEYRPTMQLSARFVSASRVVIYADQIFYNGLGQTGEAIILDPDPAFSLAKFDEIEVDPERTVNGLRAAILAVSTQLADQLAK